MNKILILFIFTMNFVMGQNPIYHDVNVDFKKGQRYALFGNDVKFRKAPNTKSKVINTLKIGSEIEILEKTTETITYNGLESPFYKVAYQGKTGYVLGGLISLEKKKTENATYLFAYKKEEAEYSLLVRSLQDDVSFTETSTVLGHSSLSIDLVGDKGVNGVENILSIDNRPEACGVEGGIIYFFETKEELKKVFATTVHSDAGVFWFNEELTFPEDEGGVEDRIVYRKEQGEHGDETTYERHITIVIKELRWENGAILPRIEY